MNWHGHVMWRDIEHILRNVLWMDMNTREKENRMTENKMERPVPMGHDKYWTGSGRGDGQGDME